MALNTLKLWEKLGFKRKEITADPDTDIRAIRVYIEELHYDSEKLLKLLKELQSLRKDAAVLSDEQALAENLRKQIDTYDNLLLRYEYFEQDADINGIRVKNVARHLMEKAKEKKLYTVIDKIKKESRWMFDW